MSDQLPTLFAPDVQRLRKLDSAGATRLVRDLLYCGALPLRLRDVVISERISVKDGGIDAMAVAETETNGAVLCSFHFQIKSGSSFDPAREGSIRKELFGSASASGAKSALGQAVRRCLDGRGVYVLVATGHDLIPIEHDSAERHLKKAFAECGYRDAHVHVWGASQLASKMRAYPSLCLDVNGVSRGAFETVSQWASRVDLRGALALGEPQKEFIKTLAETLRGDSIQHVRVIGEAGSGKTRLTLEAIRSSEDLAARCVYAASPRALLSDASTLIDLVDDERGYWTILVVDDCDAEDRATIYAMVKGKPRLKLVTLDHGPEPSRDESMLAIQFPKLGEHEIGKILATYLGEQTSLHNWIEWCKGSARSAHILGENLKLNPDDILKSPATVKVWDRFVIGYKRADEAESERLLTEMRHIALFRKFGFKGRFKGEATFLAKLIGRAAPAVTKRSFVKDVQRFVDRRILQGDSTLQIVPPALHVHLWREWWSNYGSSVELTSLLEQLPETLLGWFADMVRYANGSPEAQYAVKEALCAPESPFAKSKFLRSDRGAAFLSALAEADPASTLGLLERTTDKWLPSNSETSGRTQSLVHAIEKIAVWEDFFAPAAALLVKISGVERSRYSNNAIGTLRNLFQISGATQAPPAQRLFFIQGLLASASEQDRALAIDLCGKLLDTRGAMRVVGVEYQGALPTIQLWKPKTWTEIYEPWRATLDLLMRQQRPSDLVWQAKLSRTIVEGAMGLLEHPSLLPQVLAALEGQLSFAGADHEMLVKNILHFFRYREAKATAKEITRLRTLLQALSTGSYERRFARFVEYETHEENYTLSATGDLVDSSEPAERVSKLAGEMVADSKIVDAHLDRAIESEGYRVREFGERLGEASEQKLRAMVIGRAKKLGAAGSARFLSGFLEGLRRIDSAEADAISLDLLDGKNPAAWRVSAAVWSGATTAMMPKLVKLAKTLPPGLFIGFEIEPIKSSLPPSSVEKLIRSLLVNEAPNAAHVALDIAFWWFGRDASRTCSEALLWKVITDRRLLGDGSESSQYHWEKLARTFQRLYPTRDVELLEAFFKAADKLPWTSSTGSDVSVMLKEICAAHPKKAWKVVTHALEHRKHSWLVSEWLGGRARDDGMSPPILSFNPGQIFAWIDKRPSRRTARAIDFIPKTLEGPTGLLTVAFIERYGGSSDIARSLAFHFGPTSYVGPPSEHYTRQREQALRWSAASDSPRVRAFLDVRIKMLTEDIERDRTTEERG